MKDFAILGSTTQGIVSKDRYNQWQNYLGEEVVVYKIREVTGRKRGGKMDNQKP